MWASYFKNQENPYMHCNMQLFQFAPKVSLEVISLSIIRWGWAVIHLALIKYEMFFYKSDR